MELTLDVSFLFHFLLGSPPPSLQRPHIPPPPLRIIPVARFKDNLHRSLPHLLPQPPSIPEYRRSRPLPLNQRPRPPSTDHRHRFRVARAPAKMGLPAAQKVLQSEKGHRRGLWGIPAAWVRSIA